MQNTLNVFISRPLGVILNKILFVDETVCSLVIQSDVTVGECARRLHTSKSAKFEIRKITYLFIIIKVQMVTISSVIPYISETNSTSSSLKKKTLKREGGKEKEMEKRRRRKKSKERVCLRKAKGKRENEMGKKRRKKRRENEREGEGEERRGRERRGENRESDTRNVSPYPDASPSMKLGNNTTPIKGRLGKNTTPTGRRSIETGTESPNGSPAKTTKLRRFILLKFRCTPERAEDSEYGLHSNEAAIYKKAEAPGKSRNRSQFPMNQH